ncbi:hypothetical protein DL991_24520 [Amycolatopsis sp. WAC 01375]|uniref:hypothetical protein n=1 Tax=unclassified Amycolatopsis TaxID=2618356 RepID=UPI000F770053|nr:MULTISPECIES: hypothetical protein [unclassified Amycolatopsis]RSM76390.1 hypothetical protein DL991_24520 [Amycolatopsis sp. WAC 01375]RSN33389.1 hypothetical protein DL990_15585 [Amycolatopsis sp. WAC 01416]
MTEEVRNRPLEMPRQLKFVRVFLWVQAVLNILVSALVTALAINELDHGNEEAGLALALALLGFVVAVVLIACAIRISRGSAWVRPTVIAVEGLAVVMGLISLVNGGAITQLIGMGIAVGIIVTLNKPEERAWFTR